MDEFHGLRCGVGRKILRLRVGEGTFRRELSENINQDSVRLGDVEADIRDGVLDELVDHRENRLLDDGDIYRRCQRLGKISKLEIEGMDGIIQ